MQAGGCVCVAALIRQWNWNARAGAVRRPSSRLLSLSISGFNRCLWCVCGISIGMAAAGSERGAARSSGPHFARTYSLSLSPSLALLILKCRKWANEMGDLQAHIPSVRVRLRGRQQCRIEAEREGDRREGERERGGIRLLSGAVSRRRPRA